MRVRSSLLLAAFSISLFACSAVSKTNTFGQGGGGSGQGTTGSGNPSGTTSSGSGDGGDIGLGGAGPSGSGGSTGMNCNSGPNDDSDKDGFTGAEGDCNDCDANVNPGAVEVIAPPNPDGSKPPAVDEDCDGQIDNIAPPCDDGLAVADNNAMNAAKAVELCQQLQDPKKWGVKSAKWVLPDGASAAGMPSYDLGHGILSGFGPNVNVQGGKRMLALSSGTARQPTDPGYQDVGGFDKGYTTGNPQGFPKESPACPGTITGEAHDGAALQLEILTPTNAQGFSFSFNFFTYEWPDWICSTFNDFFVSILMPFPANQQDGNISFDSQGNPVSVNNAFLEVCGCFGGPPCIAGGKNFSCALGASKLLGTGFGADTAFADHGSTYWLQTQAPVQPHSNITIRWAVYDSGDGILDTTTLVDNWQWTATPGTEVVTAPIGTPK
ncbi:MAG: putative metal-binding motif-containing protein [Byssovorax sp.]